MRMRLVSIKQRNTIHVSILLACLAFVYIGGLSRLTAEPIAWFSEWHSLKHLFDVPNGPAFTIAETLNSVSARSSDHGPLYFVLLNIWNALVGRDLATFRLLSVFFALIALAFSYRLALITGNRGTALDTVLLLSFLSAFVYHTVPVRMYSLLPLLAAFVAWQYWRVIAAAHVKRRHWLALSVGAAALVATHYFGVILPATIGLYHLIFVRKERRWLQVCLAMLLAGCLFAPWLPTAMQGLAETSDASDRLGLLDAAMALLSLYSNGIVLVTPAAAIVLLRNWRSLTRARGYLIFLAGIIFLLMLALNEVSPVLIARRLRYTILWAIPLNCAIAIALSFLPRRNLFRIALLALWIVAFQNYNSAPDFLRFTNRLTSSSQQVNAPHYQDFWYESERLPGRDELILSLHPDDTAHFRILDTYRKLLDDWAHVAHISYQDGALQIQSGLTTYATLDAIEENAASIWLLHNPRVINLEDMPVYTDWLLQEYQLCRRYLESTDNIIDYLLRQPIPCDLINAETPYRNSLRERRGLSAISHIHSMRNRS